MNRSIYLIITLLSLLFLSCEDRTGYYNNEQQDIIAKLTAHEWIMSYAKRQGYEPEELSAERRIYRFNPAGTGSCKWMNPEDGTLRGEPVYFRWTFTNDNFSVIYVDKEQQFWLIDKLTSTELWVYCAAQDPAIYPSPDKWFYKFTEF